MLEFFKKLFGSKPAAKPAPYKVETPKVEVAPKADAKSVAKPKSEKKPVVKKATTRKPRAPKAPKA